MYLIKYRYFVVHYKKISKGVTALKGESKLNIKSLFFIMKRKFIMCFGNIKFSFPFTFNKIKKMAKVWNLAQKLTKIQINLQRHK